MKIGDRVRFVRTNASLNYIQIFVGDEATITGFSGCRFSNIIFDNGFNYTIENSFIELIKEDKVEKIEVRSWEDLEGYVVCKDAAMTDKKKQRRCYGGCIFKVNSLENCIKILNVLGGNFEYIEVEVIDTLERWEEFQERLSKNNFFYDRTNKGFLKLESNDEDSLIGVLDENLDPTYIERKFNVDLKILKG